MMRELKDQMIERSMCFKEAEECCEEAKFCDDEEDDSPQVITNSLKRKSARP